MVLFPIFHSPKARTRDNPEKIAKECSVKEEMLKKLKETLNHLKCEFASKILVTHIKAK